MRDQGARDVIMLTASTRIDSLLGRLILSSNAGVSEESNTPSIANGETGIPSLTSGSCV